MVENRCDLTADIKEMMYGFGDCWPPDPEVVSFIDVLVKNYIEDLGQRANQIGDMRGRLDKDCFLFLVRKDRRKFQRVQRLLDSYQKLEDAKNIGLKESDDNC